MRLASATDSEAGGYRDATLEVKGDSVFSKLKFEAGVHRVQRVPATETAGRVHWDFNDAGECAGMGLFAAVRLLKAIEVSCSAAPCARPHTRARRWADGICG